MLGLEVASDDAWADLAAGDIDALLVDHAHCEMKAATNAMSLASRGGDLALVRALSDLAREELDHFVRVVAFLEKRGLVLGPPRVDPYAAALRRAKGALPSSPFGRDPGLVDRLLVAALIEARSCERFKRLLAVLDEKKDPELHAFYEELFACEAAHHRRLVDLAVDAARGPGDGAEVRAAVVRRLSELARLEGAIVRGLAASGGDAAARATVHG